jgi:hypothetical protein
MILGALCVTLANISQANAVACAKGVYRAGCAGPNGAVVTRKPAIVAPPKTVVVVPAQPVVVTPKHCHIVNGVQVCR